MNAEALIAGALAEFAVFVGEDPPSVLQGLYWHQSMQRRLEAFCAIKGLNMAEIDHEWRKALGVQ
jgi:hypothetical protein